MKVSFSFVIVFAAIFVATQAEKPKQKLKKFSDECRDESGVSEKILVKVRKHKKVENPKLEDYALCVLKKAEFINDSGDFQIDTIKKKFKENVSVDKWDDIDKLVNKCTSTKGETPKESALKFFFCVHEPGEGQRGRHHRRNRQRHHHH